MRVDGGPARRFSVTQNWRNWEYPFSRVFTVPIRQAAETALKGDVANCRLKLPEQFTFDITYKEHPMALRASYFPGAVLAQPHTIRYESDDYSEVLRLFAFVL